MLALNYIQQFINAALPLLKLSQHRYAAQLAARLRQHTPITTQVGTLLAGHLHLGVGGRVLLIVICIRDDAAGQVARRGGQADPRPLAGHQDVGGFQETVLIIPSGLLRVSRGPCSRRAIVAGPMVLAVLGLESGPMGMAGAVYIVPSDHYWEVI